MSFESHEYTELLPLETSHDAVEVMEESLNKEIPLYEALDQTAERLREGLIENAEALQDFLSPLKELKEPLSEVFGEFGEVIGGLLEAGVSLLEKGVEWLKENLDLVEGAFKVILLVLLAQENPELVLKYISERPRDFKETLDELPNLHKALEQ